MNELTIIKINIFFFNTYLTVDCCTYCFKTFNIKNLKI